MIDILKQRTFIATILFLLTVSMYSQRTVSGLLVDAVSGETLIGANILIENTTIGTVSDIDGRYSIVIPDGAIALIFSYSGYQSQTIQIDEGIIINVRLNPGELLDEVILIGYGEVKRKDLTGSLQSVKSEDFNKGAIASPQQLLSGKVAGVSITSDGNPGGGSTIRIRGESSLSATNDPLIVIDGIPMDNGDIFGSRNNLNIVNPSDIETMTVLKDASATAIYGNRASAGVILITTKKGKASDGLTFEVSTKFSTGKITNKVNVLNTEAFRNLVEERFEEGSAQRLLLGSSKTDWQDEIYQSATGTEHNLSVSGGIAGVPFRATIGYMSQQGLLKTDNFERFTGSLNVTPRFLDNRLQINAGLKFANLNNHFADNGAIGSAVGFDPTQDVLSSNEDYGGYFAWRNSETGDLTGLAPANPLALLYQRDDISSPKRYIGNFSADYRFGFLPALRANLNLGYDYSDSEGTVYVDTTAAFSSSFNESTGVNDGGTNNTYHQTKKNSLFEFYLNYKKQLLGNDFDLMAGYSWQHFSNKSESNDSNIRGTITSIGKDAEELYMLSFFSRVNYNLDGIALFTATLRQDHTSRFAPKNRVGLFPAVGIAFPIRSTGGNTFDNIKARIGWGVTGQQDIGGYYLHQGLYQKSFDNARYLLGDKFETTFRPNGYDSGIKWETTTTYNTGIDVSVIKNRLSTTIDVYLRKTEDLLNFNIQAPVGSNLTNVIATNIGNMESKGIEMSINTTPILTKNLSWTFSTNFSINRNEITKLNKADSTSIGEEIGGISGGVGNTIQVLTVGFEPFSFYVYEQSYDELGGVLPGQFEDRNDDGIINNLDKYRIETSSPKFVLGLSSQLNFKDFSFSFAGRAHLGHQIYNNVATGIGYQTRLSDLGVLKNLHASALENQIENQSEILFSDAYIQDASFFRMDHITLGYRIKKIMGVSLNIFTTIQNAFIITSYEGLDPEVFKGIDNNLYPRPRIFSVGLNAKF